MIRYQLAFLLAPVFRWHAWYKTRQVTRCRTSSCFSLYSQSACYLKNRFKWGSRKFRVASCLFWHCQKLWMIRMRVKHDYIACFNWLISNKTISKAARRKISLRKISPYKKCLHQPHKIKRSLRLITLISMLLTWIPSKASYLIELIQSQKISATIQKIFNLRK